MQRYRLVKDILGRIDKTWNWYELKATNDFPWIMVGYVNLRYNQDFEPERYINNIYNKFIVNNELQGYYNTLENAWFVELLYAYINE
jgi:hypothetical protein